MAKRRHHKQGEIVYLLGTIQRRAEESDDSITDICDQLGIATATYYGWRTRLNSGELDGVQPVEPKRLRQTPKPPTPTPHESAKPVPPTPPPSTPSPPTGFPSSVNGNSEMVKENELLRRLVIDKELKILALRDLLTDSQR